MVTVISAEELKRQAGEAGEVADGGQEGRPKSGERPKSAGQPKSAFDLPFEPTTMRENQLRYASTLIEPYDMALLQADWIKATFGLSIDELPHYRRMVAESRSCVYDFDDGMRLIVVPELWPVGEESKSVIRASGFDHPAVVAENSTWEPDGAFAAEIGRRFSQLIGVSMDRLMFVGLTPLGLPCWITEDRSGERETIQ